MIEFSTLVYIFYINDQFYITPDLVTIVNIFTKYTSVNYPSGLNPMKKDIMPNSLSAKLS